MNDVIFYGEVEMIDTLILGIVVLSQDIIWEDDILPFWDNNDSIWVFIGLLCI